MPFKTYPYSAHQIDKNLFDQNAIYITEKLKAAGFEAYIVGGSIRDLILNKEPKDFDISTSAKPEEIKKLFRNSILIGKRFRLAHIRFGKKVFEVSTFRSGDTSNDTLIVRDNEWGSREEDAMRRDFTINGLFYDPSDETLIDYVGGMEDLKTHTLRSIGNAFTRFKQDPVRMIRLIKFQARFGFNIDSESVIALAECRTEILKSSQARIFEELMCMIESGSSTQFMKLLTEHGFLELLAPGLNQCFCSPLASEIYSFLEVLDTKSQTRLMGMSCMLLPILDRYLKTHFEDRNSHPNFGQIQEACFQLLHEAFSPFFLIPKRFKADIVSVLTNQFRLTPLEAKKKTRAPGPELLIESLQLLELRAELEPALGTILSKWQQRINSTFKTKSSP